MPPAKPSQSGRRRGAKPKGRPVQGNPPDDRIPRGPDLYRPKRVCADLFPACSCAFSNHPAGPQDAFFKAYGIYQPDVGFFENPTWAGELPPASRSRPGPRTRREDHAPLIVPMSSGRLFLDQVGRHQSLSPLHRQAQINTHSSLLRRKGDISTLQERGHSYFALTLLPASLDLLLARL